MARLSREDGKKQSENLLTQISARFLFENKSH